MPKLTVDITMTFIKVVTGISLAAVTGIIIHIWMKIFQHRKLIRRLKKECGSRRAVT